MRGDRRSRLLKAVDPVDSDSDDAEPVWHALTVAAVLELLSAGKDGLSSEEASHRLEVYGPNVLDGRSRPSAWKVLGRQFTSVLVWVLLGAAFVGGVVLGDVLEAIAILAIVVINGVIGFVQEWRAEDAMEALQKLAAPTVRVTRDGKAVTIAAADLVPGDVMVLEAGDRLAADARVIEAMALSVDESALTGESFPVEKVTVPAPSDSMVGDRTSMVFGGTNVGAGRGRAIVTGTGRRTEMGRIAGMLTEDEPPTPLQRELASIGRRVTLLAGVAAVVVLVVGLASGGTLQSLFLVAVALAVAAIPEGLPAVTTITLARGVRSMAERHAIVRSLPAVEALGAAQVICTDKTGTLTRNRMVVQAMAHTDGGDAELRLRRALALCSDVRHGDAGLVGDPTEVALAEWVGPELEALRGAHPRVAEIAFDSDRKRMVTIHRYGDRWLVAVKGAPEAVAPLAASYAGAEGDLPLDDAGRELRLEEVVTLARGGLRTIAVAEGVVDGLPEHLEDAERGLTWLGVAGMADETRPEAQESISTCRTAGIDVVMLTGDHLVTASAVADEIGLLQGRSVVDHGQLAAMDDDELASRIETIGAFARVEPVDKVRIVKAWQKTGRLVSMTGDGVNDAPALRMADIGVAMGSGTDVAKDASDVVLADDNFATIVAAVERGRAIFANLRKVTYFLLAANLSEITVMVAGFLLFASYGEPLVAVQLLWVNLVTDGLPALALGLDPPARDIMKRPPDLDRNILGLAHQGRLVWQGAVLACGPLALFWYGVATGMDWPTSRSMAFTGLVAVQLVHALTVRAQGASVFRTRLGNPWLVWSLAASFGVHAVAISTSVGQRLLDTTPFPGEAWAAIAAAAILPALVIDLIKTSTRRFRPGASTAGD